MPLPCLLGPRAGEGRQHADILAGSTLLWARLGNGERKLGWMRNEERPWRVLKEAEVNFERGSWLWPTFRSYWLFLLFRSA